MQPKKRACKADEATGELKENKIADQIVKPKLAPKSNSGNAEEIIILPEQIEGILKKLRQVL